MTKQYAMRLAEQWSKGLVCSMREGEAEQYHKMFLDMLRSNSDNFIVRCEDCIHFQEDDFLFYCNSVHGMVRPEPDGFCSYGKRRDKENA